MPSREARPGDTRVLLFLGLDGSGTTTILYQITLGGHLQTIPTLGFNHEEVQFGQLTYKIWDIGGLDKMRPIWRQYCAQADGIVFGVDAANRGRFKEAAEELKKVFSEQRRGKGRGKKKKLAAGAPDVPLLIFANKQDLTHAASAEQVEEALNLRQLPVKSYKVVECSARLGSNIPEGLKWMADQLEKDHYPKIKPKG